MDRGEALDPGIVAPSSRRGLGNSDDPPLINSDERSTSKSMRASALRGLKISIRCVGGTDTGGAAETLGVRGNLELPRQRDVLSLPQERQSCS